MSALDVSSGDTVEQDHGPEQSDDPAASRHWQSKVCFLLFDEVIISHTWSANGSFARVNMGTYRGQEVAIKSVRVNLGSAASVQKFGWEAFIWGQLRHPNIVHFHGVSHRMDEHLLVCEYTSRGTLLDYLPDEKAQGRVVMWRTIHDVALGICFVHSKGFIHNDIKSNNVVVDSDGIAKLTDFGQSFIEGQDRPWDQEQNRAVRWMAPEILLYGTQPSAASDSYAFGMLIIEAMTGLPPWGIIPDGSIKSLVHRRKFPQQPSGASDDQWSLVNQLCAYEPKSRPSMMVVLPKLKQFADQERAEATTRLSEHQAQLAANVNDRRLEYYAPEERDPSQHIGDGGANISFPEQLSANEAPVIVEPLPDAWEPDENTEAVTSHEFESQSATESEGQQFQDTTMEEREPYMPTQHIEPTQDWDYMATACAAACVIASIGLLVTLGPASRATTFAGMVLFGSVAVLFESASDETVRAKAI